MRPAMLGTGMAGAARLLALSWLVVGASAQGDSWPEYRGPTAGGRADGAAVPLTWSESDNVRWKTAIHGRGWSSPVVRDGRIWVTTATADGRGLFAVCVDLESGEVLHDLPVFEVEAPQKVNALNTYASPSPVIEKGRVYVHFGTYGTACLDGKTGQEVWRRRDLRCDHMEGPGSSPILHGDFLILNVDGTDVQYVVALNKRTGETVWKADRSVDLSRKITDMRKAFSTPLVVDVEGASQLVSSGAFATVAYDPRTGGELWTVRHPGFSMSSRPVAGDGLIYVNTGFMRPELWAIRLGGEGDVSETHVEWKCQKSVPSMASPVLVDDRFFMVNDGGIATCLDAKTGEAHWRERIGGEYCASPVHASGRVYFFDRGGRATVVAANDEFQHLAENRLDGGFMASPAVVGDAFVLRTVTHLYRIEEIEDDK